ncbi:hypothetical protein ACU8MP_19350 [Rhizobium leguminosarum]|uniref:hypothetical protein n=1 Tax=Rhizobium leguminosarum TaxID=384 RepID=UPI001030F171|nr:hypothetical protein [Rhizobium leguminosarum]QIO73924.1 hypothetical protein HA459_18650 [Rhizobium leguminosarum bv. trifolii]QIO80943.1 hypothetical protein HA460_18690 [Rhizobium leguminosarum bv. trifolii]TAU22565.1 hypothetical protein ELI50_19155 [Rhizobium leguminosarum]TAV12974.1 hypothetical protein ELI37_21910 [Rhizobium leguminosarum]TAZ63716.1 hypothetical protein ELH75_21885 [Rhizobium leguminosarum]
MKAAGIGAAIFALLAMLVFPVWQAWIYQFQTLISGLAAVGAAALTIAKMEETIRVMERTDSASAERHRQLVKLQRSPDQLRMERALHPQIADLQHIHAQFKAFNNARNEIEAGEMTDFQWVTVVGRRYFGCFEEITSVLTRVQFLLGVTLFDGITTRYLDQLTRANGIVIPALRLHLGYLDGEIADPIYPDRFEASFHEIEHAIVDVVGLLARVIESLQFMKRSYEAEAE